MSDVMTKETRLAVYGTLAPGEVNEAVLHPLEGRWVPGEVRGKLIASGWGADHGCPGMRPDPNGEVIPVQLFISADLPQHWPRLDAFEGDEYQRESIVVSTAEGDMEASIYALKP